MKTRLLAAFASAAIVSACTVRPPELQRAPLDSEVEDSLDSYVADAAATGVPIDAVMLLQHGKVIGERYVNGWQKDSVHHMWSVSKSFTSLAVGYAIDEGLLHMDDRIGDIFPDRQGDSLLLSATVRDFLSMSTGQEGADQLLVVLMKRLAQNPDFKYKDMDDVPRLYDEMGNDILDDFFQEPATCTPGEKFCYNSMASYTLSAAVQKVTGETIDDYLEPRLWKKIGVGKPDWRCVNGVNCGGWGLYANAELMAKTGQMLLDNGRYGGKKVVSPEYIVEASTPRFNWGGPESCPTGYALQFWCIAEGFFASGAHGQFIIVMPELDAVMVGIADIEGEDHDELALMWKHLVPVLRIHADIQK